MEATTENLVANEAHGPRFARSWPHINHRLAAFTVSRCQ